jgi:hypothetical protein
MAMRGTLRSPKRAGKEFVRNLIWVLVVFGPLDTLVLFSAGIPLVLGVGFRRRLRVRNGGDTRRVAVL